MNKFLGQLEHEKQELESRLEMINEALSHKEYSSSAYEFAFVPGLTNKDFTHPGNREVTEACNQATVHLVPDVALQLIETEMFERMKKIISLHINGKSIAYLMGMKNDLERRMLNDQLKGISSKIEAKGAEIEAIMPKEVDPLITTDEHLEKVVKEFKPKGRASSKK